jgi:hypothetical protein
MIEDKNSGISFAMYERPESARRQRFICWHMKEKIDIEESDDDCI